MRPAAPLLASLAAADFLTRYSGTRETWLKRFDPRVNTLVYISDLGDAWPLDMPPWEFVSYVVNKACTDPRACWFRALQVPATVALADDREPQRANITVTIEGIFEPHRPCCSKDDLVKIMTVLLQELYDPKRTEFFEYHAHDPRTNQTDVVYQPMYAIPKAIGVGKGWPVFQPTNFLSIKIDSHTMRRTPRYTCSLFTREARQRFRTKIRTATSTTRRLSSINCLWFGRNVEPEFPPRYISRADRILKGLEEGDKRSRGDLA